MPRVRVTEMQGFRHARVGIQLKIQDQAVPMV